MKEPIGDLPDVISTPFHLSKFEVYAHAHGSIIDLTDLIAQHAPNVSQRHVDDPLIAKQVTFPDGKLYAMPGVEFGCYHCTMSPKMRIYQSWIDALEVDSPTTTSEFRNMLLQFRAPISAGSTRMACLPRKFSHMQPYAQDNFMPPKDRLPKRI